MHSNNQPEPDLLRVWGGRAEAGMGVRAKPRAQRDGHRSVWAEGAFVLEAECRVSELQIPGRQAPPARLSARVR